MKIKNSIQNKIILLILVGILFSSLTIGGLGIASFGKELDKSVESTMNLICQEKAEEVNSILGRIEQSTEVMAVLFLNYMEHVDDLKDDAYRTGCVETLMQAGHYIASNTNGAIGVFLRLNPEIAGPTEGFYWLADDTTGELVLQDNTDLSKYQENDNEHVGWYDQPVKARKAIWVDPYTTGNTKRKMVSYVIPIFKEKQLAGVIGMDVDWAYITDTVDEIKVYDTGYAFLTDEKFNIAYSKEFEPGTNVAGFRDELKKMDLNELLENDSVYELNFNGQNKTVAFTSLNNGKIIAVIAPKDEINADYNALVLRIIGLVFVTSFVFVLVSVLSANTIIRPLKELNKAALDIAEGNLDVELNIHSNDEVGTLAHSFSETAKQLKIKISYINDLAFSDKLTGIKNSTAYLQEVVFLKNDVLQKKADFAIFVIDVNGLKFMNDNYGHEIGNELLIKATQMIVEVFGEENVYRIGGDEFAVLLSGITETECENYRKVFGEVLEAQKGKIWAFASMGYAVYQKNLDSTYESVFNRADEDMYEQKVRMKALGKNSKLLE